MKEWELFKLEFDPNPTEKYPHGYWNAYTTLGFEGDGPTPDIAMANLIIALIKAYQKDAV
jgi:hypothetical protein